MNLYKEDQLSKKSHRFHGKADNTAHNYNSRENIVDINSFRKPSLQKVKLLPKNLSQEAYIEALEDNKKHIVFGIGPAGTGKAQPLDAKIKIPHGWIRMGDIKVGDTVSTPNGKTAKVIGIFPQGIKETYKIELKDGRTTEACGDHLWEVFYDQNKHPKIISTKEIIEFRKNHKRNQKIRLPEHEEIDDIDLPIDPYLLGALLGDGGFSAYPGIFFTTRDHELLSKINEICKDDGIFLPRYSNQKSYDYGYCMLENSKKIIRAKGEFGTKLKTKINELKLFGTKSDTKFIPEIYLSSSKNQKIRLLQGLLDTDGYASTNNELIFTTVSKSLCDSVVYLIRSIGGTASVSIKYPRYTYLGEKKTGKEAYNVTISYKNKTELVTLTRKKKRLRDNDQYSMKGTISIKDIRPSGEKECQCIMLDSEDHLYITDDFIVTHNTYLSTLYAIQAFQNHTIDKIIITRPAVSVDEKHGFLPGSLVDKMEPWIMPILDVFSLHYSKKEIEKLIEYNKLEVAPLAFMRGRNFANSVILGDEMQNSTPSQMKMLLTRIGEGSKLIITGDLEQHDAGYEKNGLLDFIQRFENHSNIAITRFSNRDVERHPIIEDILSMYKKS